MSNKLLKRKWKNLVAVLIGIIFLVTIVPNLMAKSSKAVFFQQKTVASIIQNLPTAAEIQAMPLTAHPRLLASEARFEEIKRQIETDETMRRWYKKLHQRAEKLLQKKLPKYELPDNKRLLIKIHHHVSTLAFLYRIEPDRRYLDRIWQELQVAAQFPDWNPSHFLGTAKMTYAFALGYDWLYDEWNEKQRTVISSAIIDKGLKPALKAYRVDKKILKSDHNWNQVCNGGIGLGALAIMEREPQLASKTLSEALKRLPNAMQTYSPDGGWEEGPSYWHFGTFYNTLIIAALDTSLSSDFGLSEFPGFDETGLFPIYMNGAFDLSFNFSDGDARFIRAPELFWMSDRFQEPAYNDYQQKSDRHGAMDLLWYKPRKRRWRVKPLPLDRYFQSAEVVSMRSEWNNPQGIFVGFKAGDNQANHSNLDLGTFVIDALGVRWAVELGKDNYNLPGYFERKKQRWQYYKTRAEGQNTLVVNPDYYPDQNPQAKARIIRFVSQPHKSYAIADLTPAYQPKVQQLQRTVTLDRQRQQVSVQDKIQANNPVELWWFMHTKADIKISQDGKTAILNQNGSQLSVRLMNSQPNYRLTIMDARPLPSSPNPKGQQKNLGIKKLAVQLKNVRNESITIVFTPLSKNPTKSRNLF